MQGITTKQIAIRLPANLNDRLQKMADAENNHVSATARRLLTAALDREDESASQQRRRGRA